VIGLGYVGLPVAVSFARSGVPVIGFDVDAGRIAELQAARDRTNEVKPGDLSHPTLTVPTPIDLAHRPDLSALLRASEIVGGALAQGDIVV
jgi:UDP-N-acetyl-D-glucosamine/UDP-N-acetyl-D-galactosamine dehydrogenase